jgi:adenylate cyclase
MESIPREADFRDRDVLRGRVNLAQELNDKLVLIGQGSDAAHDKHFTPVFRPPHRVLLSGAEIHAAAIATLLSGPSISTLSPGFTWAAIFLSVWIVIWLTLRTPLRGGIAIVGVGFILFYTGSQGLFTFSHVWVKFLAGELALGLSLPMSLGYEFIQERVRSKSALAERQQIMQLFSRYVSTEVAAQIWERRSELSLAGQERDATVVFTDIRSFTQLTAGKPSAAVLAWLNNYFTAMDEVIRQEGGFLNKFIGDGLMILFGVPLTEGLEKDAWSAVRCGIRMLQRVDKLNRENQDDPNFLPIKIGVGIHTGGLTCGSVGSQERLEYSVIGETVNLASRLESLTKDFHVPLIMSGATYDAVRAHAPNARNLGVTPVRGFDCPIQVYTVDINDADLSDVTPIVSPQKVTQ